MHAACLPQTWSEYCLPRMVRRDIQKQTLPLLLAPGALPNLQSLALDSRWGLFMVEVPRGALRLLSSLTQLHFNAQLVRGECQGDYGMDGEDVAMVLPCHGMAVGGCILLRSSLESLKRVYALSTFV